MMRSDKAPANRSLHAGWTALLVMAMVIAAACSGDDDSTGDATADGTAARTITSRGATGPDATGPATTDVETTPATTAPAETTVAPPENTAPLPTTAATATPTTSPTTAVGSTEGFDAIGPVVDEFLGANDMNGAGLVVVDRDDGVVYAEYWGEINAERQSFIASSSKMITAGVLMRLADDGMLDLDAPVADVVEWGSGNPDITPAQLVSNSSGLVGLLPNPAYGPYMCQYAAGQEIEACAETILLTPDDDGDVIAPDTSFRYGGAQWQVAGAVAEAASGRPWDELIQEIYIEPCGVDSLGYNQLNLASGFDYPVGVVPSALEPTENPNMEAGAYIAAPDYAELLLMHLRGGECANGQVMSAEAIDRLHADRTLDAYPDGSGAGAPGYGMGWWVDRDSGRISDAGAYGTRPWLDLEEGYGAYLVVEANGELGGRLSAMIEPLIDDAMVTHRAG